MLLCMTRSYRRFRKAITILKREVSKSFLCRSSPEEFAKTSSESRREERLRRVAREPALREAIDEACRYWANHQKWPRMDQEAARFVFDRVANGRMFGWRLV